MKPYYQDSAVTIYHGDCRDILEWYDLSNSAIVGDAPYGIGLDYGTFQDTEDAVRELASSITKHLMRAKRAAILCGVPQMWLWPKPKWVLCWSYYPATNEFSPWGYAQWQPILVYGKDPFLEKGKGPRPTVFTRTNPPNRKGNDHPCPKPDDVMTAVILRTTSESDVVIDPFMGSGTTLRAAKDLGRKAIGIDLEERYCEIAAKRMEQEVLPLITDDPETAAEPSELALA